jgi:hypothetical protein
VAVRHAQCSEQEVEFHRSQVASKLTPLLDRLNKPEFPCERWEERWGAGPEDNSCSGSDFQPQLQEQELFEKHSSRE